MSSHSGCTEFVRIDARLDKAHGRHLRKHIPSAELETTLAAINENQLW